MAGETRNARNESQRYQWIFDKDSRSKQRVNDMS